MKRNGKKLPVIMAGLGGVMLVLLMGLALTATDEKGLLTAGHPLTYGVLAVAAACLVLALLAALGSREDCSAVRSMPIAALGDCLFAIALGITVLSMGFGTSGLEWVRALTGILCVPCLLYSGWCRAKGKPVFFGCFAVVCVFMALYLVGCYREWSSNPQLLDYLFAMVCCIALTMFAYQYTALHVGIGSRRLWLASGLAAISFGFAAIYRWENLLLYLGGANWALTALLGAQMEENG